jgi:hypothetical protein
MWSKWDGLLYAACVLGVIILMFLAAPALADTNVFLNCSLMMVNSTPTLGNCTSFTPESCGADVVEWRNISSTLFTLNSTLSQTFIGQCFLDSSALSSCQDAAANLALIAGNASMTNSTLALCLYDKETLQGQIYVHQANITGDMLAIQQAGSDKLFYAFVALVICTAYYNRRGILGLIPGKWGRRDTHG